MIDVGLDELLELLGCGGARVDQPLGNLGLNIYIVTESNTKSGGLNIQTGEEAVMFTHWLILMSPVCFIINILIKNRHKVI